MAGYEIKKSVLGHKVYYSCPACGVPLTSPFEKAGTNDTCPDCQRPHTVPGEKEKQEQQRTAALLQRQKLDETEQRKAAEIARLRQKEEARKRAGPSLAPDPPASPTSIPPSDPPTNIRKSTVRCRRFGDGILDTAFTLTRGFSVVVIITSIVALLITGVLIGMAYSSYRQNRPRDVPIPTENDFAEFNKSLSNSSATSPGDSSNDSAASSTDEIDAFLKKHRLNGTAIDLRLIEQRMRSIKGDVSSKDFAAFMLQFDAFLNKHQHTSKAAAWFCVRYQVSIEERDYAIKDDAFHNTAVSGRISILTTLAMTIFGGLISFMILPLLIRIETNTREVG